MGGSGVGGRGMNEMTSRERLLAAARRQEVDCIPISPRLGVALSNHCGTGTNAARLRLKSIYDYDPHLDVGGNVYPFTGPYEIFSSCPGVDVRIEVHDQGSARLVNRTITTPDGELHEVVKVPNPGRPEYGTSPNPTRTEHMIREPGDLAKLRHLMPVVHPELAHEYHNWAHVTGEEGLVRATIYGPIDHGAGEVMGIEAMMVAYLTDRDFAVELVDMFWQQIMAQTRVLCEAGVKVFFIPYYWHSLSVGWSPAIFEEWFLPMIAEQMELIHSYDGLAFYYDDGKMMKIVPLLARAGVDVVETCTPPPVGDFDLDQAKALYGEEISFKGFVDLIYVLQKGTVEDVRAQVAKACEVGGRGFILGTSDSMREGTPQENIDAYFRYGREYGRRPS